MKVQLIALFFILSGLIDSIVFCEGIEVIEKINENKDITAGDERNETSASSTNNNVTTYKENWSSGPHAEDMQRIMTPVIITSPQIDRYKNFSASPMLGTNYNPEYHQLKQEHYSKSAQKHNSHHSGQHYSSKEDERKKHQYSQPLPPDLFLAQRHLKAQQQKEQEEYTSKQKLNFPKPVHPEAKNNGFNFNSDSISYKPLKFDTDFPSTSFTSDEDSGFKQTSFHYTTNSPVKSNSHPYTYHNPYSSSETDFEPPTTSKSPVAAKEYHPGSWVDGYKSGIQYQEEEKTSMWKKVLNMLAAFIPLGLFLAALPPNILTINTTQPDLPSRQRSVDKEVSEKVDEISFPILDLLEKYGIDSLDEPECENRIFCEMSRLGGQSSGNIVQKAFWHLAHDTSDKTADAMGMKELFKAVRTNACNIYRCKEKDKSIIVTTTKPNLKEEKK